MLKAVLLAASMRARSRADDRPTPNDRSEPGRPCHRRPQHRQPSRYRHRRPCHRPATCYWAGSWCICTCQPSTRSGGMEENERRVAQIIGSDAREALRGNSRSCSHTSLVIEESYMNEKFNKSTFPKFSNTRK